MQEREIPSKFDNGVYRFFKFGLRIWFALGYRIRSHKMHKVPDKGGALICCNHQSNLDPMLVGATIRRDLHFLAKKSLFAGKLKPFMHKLHCIPLDRKKGLAGIKATIKRLKLGHLVMVFPEGTRSKDGEIKEFKGGFLMMARRAKAPVVPAALDGAHQAYPPGTNFPWPGHIHVVFGDPINYEDYNDKSDEEVMKLLEVRIRECFAIARQKREHHLSLNIRNRQPKMRLSKPVKSTHLQTSVES